METKSYESVRDFKSFAKNKSLASGAQARGESVPPTNTTETLMKDEKTEVKVSTSEVQER